MKTLVFFFLVSVSCVAGVHPLKPYYEPNPVESIGSCDTVVMEVHSAGCFHSYDQTYTFYKAGQRRTVSYTSAAGVVTKRISRRAYKKFIACFSRSYDHFSSRELTIHCTTVTSYKLSGRDHLATFSNTSCEADFEPERFLKTLLK